MFYNCYVRVCMYMSVCKRGFRIFIYFFFFGKLTIIFCTFTYVTLNIMLTLNHLKACKKTATLTSYNNNNNTTTTKRREN